MHKDYYCAYHHTQIITSFCKCRDCLLPTCATCVKLHNQQHSINKTSPDYQNMSYIFKQVNNQLQQLQTKARRLTQSLVFIQKSRKNQMNKIRNLINTKTKQIIEIFQQTLKDIDRRIINKIYELDGDFITQIEALDNQVLIIQNQITKQQCGIQSQQSLKTVISYYQSNKKNVLHQNISQLQQKINKFGRKTVQLHFDGEIDNKINHLMANLIQIQQISSKN